MKYLSVIIPFYNSADTLEKAAISCLDSRVLDEIEVIMVNDGSKDNSLEVARTIEKKFPSSIQVLDKPNGGKGSCMNVGIAKATGKYLRELDSDDYFAEGSVFKLITKIKKLKQDVDVIHTDYQFFYIDKDIFESVSIESIEKDVILNLNKIKLPELSYMKYAMHSLTYRTQFLRDIKFVQTEGISYTDTEYIYYPLTQAKNLVAYDMVLYTYCIGINGQSMSMEAMAKKQSHFKILHNKFIADMDYVKGNANATSIREKVILAVSIPPLRMYLNGKLYSKETDMILRSILKINYNDNKKLFVKTLNLGRNRVFMPSLLWFFFGSLFFKFKSCLSYQ